MYGFCWKTRPRGDTDLNRELAYVAIWPAAQIGIGIIAWLFLGGASLAQLIEAGLVALVPIPTIFSVRERQLRVRGAKTKTLTHKAAAKIGLILLSIYTILVLYSLVVPVGSYTFNLSLYVTALGFSIGFQVWQAWKSSSVKAAYATFA
jgi:hypothetical protein